MARKPVVVGNWKMHKTTDEADRFGLDLKKALPDLGGVDVGIACGGPLLPGLAAKLKGTDAWVMGQNLHWEVEGAFTGETSTAMLTSAGANGVLIGHSERRQYFGETDETVARKLARALEDNLLPIVCVGETLEQREADETTAVIERQVRGAFAQIEPERIGHCILAYEPVWAIGTGKTATGDQAQEVHHFIRELVASLAAPHVAEAVRIQYGGSVKPANAAELFSQPDIDGGLVGGASLQMETFGPICEAAQKNL